LCLGIKLAVKVKSADNDKNDVAPEISFEKLRDLAMKTKEERIQKSQAESARATEQERLIKENLSAQKEKTAALSQKPQTKLEKTEENIDTQLKELLNI